MSATKFPFTENTIENYSSGQTVTDSASARCLRIYQPSRYPISSSGQVRQVFVISVGSPTETISVSQLKSAKAERRGGASKPKKIPSNSPIHALLSLKKGWDGYWAAPLSQAVLLRVHQLWEQIDCLTQDKEFLPTIRPSANGSVAFTWSRNYPAKELEIWVYDQSDYYAEWMLSIDDKDEEGISQSQEELLDVVRRFQEF